LFSSPANRKWMSGCNISAFFAESITRGAFILQALKARV
jgi:hypothetical protein